jgi:hypothetical protein
MGAMAQIGRSTDGEVESDPRQPGNEGWSTAGYIRRQQQTVT